MIFEPSFAVISDRLQALTRALDSDPLLPGRLRIYSAPMPATRGGALGAAQLLATLTFPKPSLSGVSLKTLTLQAPAPTLVTATGDAFWARFENGGGQFVADADVGLPTDNAVVRLTTTASTLTLYAGGDLSVSLARLVEP